MPDTGNSETDLCPVGKIEDMTSKVYVHFDQHISPPRTYVAGKVE